MRRKQIAIEPGSGNVFQDLEYENAEEALCKAELARCIAKIVEGNAWTQAEAAERMGMGMDQPKVSKVLRGQLREFSIERLISFVRALGRDVEIVLKEPDGSSSPGLRVVEEALA